MTIFKNPILRAILFSGLTLSAVACSDDTDEDGGMGGEGGSDTGGSGGGDTGGAGGGDTGGSDTGGTGGGDVEVGCPEHELVTEASEGVCNIAGGTTSNDLYLTAGNDYFLEGKLFVGDDSSSTELKVDPGVTVYGGDKTFIVIQRGATIMAE
ncbi:MAG: hypothetical protein MK135_13555, partial [Polyangiaceae bacterium]|nr:hypothetical protein [Polyangiaceae bacterium]